MNHYNPAIHHRHSIRLKGYDYSQSGLYFITICTQNRACLLGTIENGEMRSNHAGQMVETEWLKLTERFPNIVLHDYVVMPNHFHAILEIIDEQHIDGIINENCLPNEEQICQQNREINGRQMGQPQGIDGQPQGIAPTTGKTVGDMMGAFQSIVTVEYIRGVNNLGWQRFNGKLWKRNFYEHIIRDEESYLRISKYIINNPSKWEDDKFYFTND